jgi:hypothetical protein
VPWNFAPRCSDYSYPIRISGVPAIRYSLMKTIAVYVARLFSREGIVPLVNNKHPCAPISTLEAGFRLMLHGLMLKTFTALSRICVNNNCNRGNEISCSRFLPLIALTRINTLAPVIHWRPYALAHERSIHCELRAFEVAHKTAISTHPREGPLDDPSLGQILSKSSITPFVARTSRHVRNELIKSK